MVYLIAYKQSQNFNIEILTLFRVFGSLALRKDPKASDNFIRIPPSWFGLSQIENHKIISLKFWTYSWYLGSGARKNRS